MVDLMTLVNLEEQKLQTWKLQSERKSILAIQCSAAWAHNLLAG